MAQREAQTLLTDRLVLGTLRKKLRGTSYKLLLLPDHFTCVETRTHSTDAVPFLAYSSKSASAKEHGGLKKKRGFAARKFSEASVKRSGVLVAKAHKLMEMFVKGKIG